MRVLAKPFCVALLATLWSADAAIGSQNPEVKGLQIALEARQRDEGFGDVQVNLRMILRDRRGDETLRELRSRVLEVENEGDKSLVIFDHPRDVRGTMLLTWSSRAGDDEQWLYLPATGRVRRIASTNRSSPFMGSEFAYEDMGSQEVEQYTYRHLRDDQYQAMQVFVLERFPVDEHSGYTRQVMWIDQEHYRPHKVEFFDGRDELLKTLTIGGYARYRDKHWRPTRMEMENHQTGRATTLLFEGYEFGVGYRERNFDPEALRSIR